MEPDLETMVLRLNLDPGRMPASLDAVLGDSWARLFKMKALASLREAQFGGMRHGSAASQSRGTHLPPCSASSASSRKRRSGFRPSAGASTCASTPADVTQGP